MTDYSATAVVVRMQTSYTSSNSLESLSRTSLDDLDDSLLMEIFQRFPTAKLTIRCKFVSKRLCSLISSPYFINRFISCRIEKNGIDEGDAGENSSSSSSSLLSRNHENTGAVVLCRRYDGKHICDIFSDQPLFGHLPHNELQREVVASFDDLIVSRVSHVLDRTHMVSEYYICNPFTMQSVPLPPYTPSNPLSPRTRTRTHTRTHTPTHVDVGLVREPYIRVDHGNCTLNHQYRYRVVLFTRVPDCNTVNVATYCSETNEWVESDLWGPEYNKLYNIVAYNEKLHWHNGRDIVAYDPFDVNQSFVINGSDEMRSEAGPKYYNIGVCGGFLRAMRVENGYLNVWELKEYGSGREAWNHVVFLRLRSVTGLDRAITFWLQAWLPGIRQLKFLCQHPTDPDIVYIAGQICPRVVLCNVRKKELKTVRMPGSYINNRYMIAGKEELEQSFFPIALPLWPTPIPTST